MSPKPVRPAKSSFSKIVSSADLEQAALVHLEKGRYRDAVVSYKALLKMERRPEWLTGLANAYSGRAKGLAATGQLEEAIALWRSRSELCGTKLWEGPYAAWLISHGRLADVMEYLSARQAAASALPDAKRNDELAVLEAQLAPALLSANEATLARLSAESPLRQHHQRALAALTAYARNDGVALEEALAGIPFRSPYRDFRSLLKAMLLWETDQAGARLALDRLTPDGPFEPLAAPLRTLFFTGTERLQHWAKLNLSQQKMALDLLGCPLTFAPLLQGLAGANLAPAALFDLVQRYARNLPNRLATRAWLWLSPWAKRQGCSNPRIFGSPTPAYQEGAQALAVEITGDWDHAESHWAGAAAQLGASAEAHDRLCAALILRHMALAPAHLSGDGMLDYEGQKMLTQSLEFDQADCDVHVRLVQYWRRNGDLRRAREQLDSGLRHFPDHVALLTQAVETALAAGAFKKAANVARQLLEFDPLNPRVRSMVGNAHLSHAVKQITANKMEAAKKEIKEAENWLGSAADQGRTCLLQAWCEKSRSPERLRLAQQAATHWGGGLAAGWRLVREAQGVFVRFSVLLSVDLLREAGLDASKLVTATEMLDLVQVLAQVEPIVRKGLSPLAPWRKTIESMASASVFDAVATVQICEALSRHHDYGLLGKFANVARTRWPDQPIFVYHAVASRFDKRHGFESGRDYDDLSLAHERALQSKDMRLSMRIEALLEDDAALDGFDDSFLPDRPNLPGVSGLPFNPLKMKPEMLRALMLESINLEGEKSFLKNARLDLGDALFQQVEREYAGDKKGFLRRLVDLVVAELTDGLSLPQPVVPAKIVKPKAPNPGQGNLFNE